VTSGVRDRVTHDDAGYVPMMGRIVIVVALVQ
jgi:hypothetical protein